MRRLGSAARRHHVNRRNDDLAVGGITATMSATPSATTTTTAGQQPHIRLPIRVLRGRVVQCEASVIIGAAIDVSAANVRNALVNKQVEGHSTVTNKESVIISSRGYYTISSSGYYSPRDAPPKGGLVATTTTTTTVTRSTINQKRCFSSTSPSSSSPSGEDIRVKEAIGKSPTALFVLDCIEFNAGTTIALEEYSRWASGVPLCSREAIRKALLLPSSSSSPSSAPSSSSSLHVSPSDNISPHAASVSKLNKSTLEQEQEEAQKEEDHLPELQAALYVGRALLEYISINNDTFIRSSSHSSCSSRNDVLVSGGGGEGIKNIVGNEEEQQEVDESVRSFSSSSLNVETQHSDPPVVAAAVLALGKALEEMERKAVALALHQPSALTTPLAQECSTMKIKKVENFASQQQQQQQQQQQERQQQSEFLPSSAPIPQRGRGIAQIASFHADLDASIKKLEEATKQWKLYESLCGKLGSNHNIYTTTTTTKGNNNNGGGGNKNQGQQHNSHKGKNNGNGDNSPYYNTAHSVLGLKGTTTDLLAPSYDSSGLSNCYSGGNNNLTLLTSAPECSQAVFLAEASLFLDNETTTKRKGEKGSLLLLDRGVGGGGTQRQQKHQLDHLDANDARTININKNALSSSSSSSIAFLQWQHKVLTEKCPLVLEDLRWLWLDALERFADLFYFCSSSEGGGKVQHTLDDDEEEENSSLKPLPITFAKLIRLCSTVLPAPPRITLPNEIEYEQQETNDFFEFSRKSVVIVNPNITSSSGGSGSGSVADRVVVELGGEEILPPEDSPAALKSRSYEGLNQRRKEMERSGERATTYDENSIDKDIGGSGQLGNKRAKCLGVNTVKRAERWAVEAERDEATARLAMQRLRRVVAVLDHGYRAGDTDTSIPTTKTNSRKGDLERKETGHNEASYSRLASSPLTVFPTASSTFVRNFDTVGLLWQAQRERYHHNQNQNHQNYSSALSPSLSSPILTHHHHHHRHCNYAEEAIEALVREHMAGYNYSNPNRRDEGEKGEEKGVGVVVNNNDSNKLGTAANNERKEEDEDRRKKKMQEIAREKASKRRVTPLVACAGGSRPLFSTRMNEMRHVTVTKRHAVAQQNFHSWVRVIPKNKIGGGDNKSFNKGSASGRGTMSVPSPFIPLSLLLATPSTCVSTQETFGTSATKSTPTDEFAHDEKDVASSGNNISVHPTHFIVNGDGSVASITKYNNKPCSRSSCARSSDQSRECESEGHQKTEENKKGVRDEDFCGENDQTKKTTMSRRILSNSARVGFISWSALLPIDWWSSPEDRCLRLLHEFCLQWEGAVQKLRDSELEEQMSFVTADSAKEKKLGEGIFDVDTVLQNSTLTTILGETAEEGIDRRDGKVVCELRPSTQFTVPIAHLSERYASLSPRLENNVVELLRLRVTRGILLATAEAAFSLESAKLGRIVLQSRLFRGRLFCMMPTPLSSVKKSDVNNFIANDGNTNDKSTTARTTSVLTSINWADINANEFLDKLEWVVNQHALQTRDRLGAEYTNNYRTGKMGSDLSDVAVSSIKTRQLFPAAVRLAAVALGARHQWQTLANFTEEQRRLLGLDSREALETTPFAHILIEAPQNGEGKTRDLGRKGIESGNNANSSASSVDGINFGEEQTVQLYDCLCAAQTFFHLNTCAYIATAIASSFNFHKKGLQQRLDRASEELDEMEPMVGPLERAVLAMEWGEEASDTEHSRSKIFRRVEKKLTSDAKIFRLVSRETRESLKGTSNSFHHASSCASLHSEDYFAPNTNNSDTIVSENMFLSTSHPPSNNTNTCHSHQPSPLKRAKVLLQGLKEAIEATRRTADTIRSELEHAELDNGVVSPPAADFPKLADYGTNTTAAATMTKPTSSCDIAWRIIQSAANEVRGNSQRANDPRQLSFLFGASSPQNSSLYLQRGQQRQRSNHNKAKISSTMTTTNTTKTPPSVSTYFSFWRTPLRLISDAAAYDIDAATVAALTSLRASSHWGPAVRLSALWYHPSSSDHDKSHKKSDESSSFSTVSSTTAEEGREGNGNNSFSSEKGLYADTNAGDEEFYNSNCRNKSNDFGDPTNSNREWGDEKRKEVRGAIPHRSENTDSKNNNYPLPVVLKDTRGFAPRCPTLEAVLLSSSCFSRGCGSSKRTVRPSSPTSSSLDPKVIYERLKLPKLRPSATTPLPAMMSSSSPSSSLTTSSTSNSGEKVDDSFPPWSGLSVDGQMTVASLMLHEQSYGWVPPPVVRKLKTWFTLRVIDDDAIVGAPPPSNRHPTSWSTHTSGKHIGGVAQTRGTQSRPSGATGQITSRDRHDNDYREESNINNNNNDDDAEAMKTNYMYHQHHHHRNNKHNNHNNNNNNNNTKSINNNGSGFLSSRDYDLRNNKIINKLSSLSNDDGRLSNRGPEQHNNGDYYYCDNRSRKRIFDKSRDEREVKNDEQRNRQWRNENERHFRNGVREGGTFQSSGRGRKVGAHRHSHSHTY